MRIAASPPAPSKNLALFLDLDGTLLDIAPTPESVVVPKDLVQDLESATRTLGRALAIVSGRKLDAIDRLLKPLTPTVAAEHGAVVRLPSGLYDEVGITVPEAWQAALRDFALKNPGIVIEIKRHSIVAHYRNVPSREADVRHFAAKLAAHNANFELLEAKMAFEIRPRQVTKGRAVQLLMKVAPFEGRVPVFVGDDKTDEDGFAAATQLGGLALDVASTFGGHPHEVRRWLKGFAEIRGEVS